MSFNELAKEIHETAVEKGWWEEDRNFGEMLALMHSELSEALESWRKSEPPFFMDEDKPEGWGTELADCVIRILDTAYSGGVDFDHVVRAKMDYNKSRPYRHGGKRA